MKYTKEQLAQYKEMYLKSLFSDYEGYQLDTALQLIDRQLDNLLSGNCNNFLITEIQIQCYYEYREILRNK